MQTQSMPVAPKVNWQPEVNHNLGCGKPDLCFRSLTEEDLMPDQQMEP